MTMKTICLLADVYEVTDKYNNIFSSGVHMKFPRTTEEAIAAIQKSTHVMVGTAHGGIDIDKIMEHAVNCGAEIVKI